MKNQIWTHFDLQYQNYFRVLTLKTEIFDVKNRNFDKNELIIIIISLL